MPATDVPCRSALVARLRAARAADSTVKSRPGARDVRREIRVIELHAVVEHGDQHRPASRACSSTPRARRRRRRSSRRGVAALARVVERPLRGEQRVVGHVAAAKLHRPEALGDCVVDAARRREHGREPAARRRRARARAQDRAQRRARDDRSTPRRSRAEQVGREQRRQARAVREPHDHARRCRTARRSRRSCRRAASAPPPRARCRARSGRAATATPHSGRAGEHRRERRVAAARQRRSAVPPWRSWSRTPRIEHVVVAERDVALGKLIRCAGSR